MKVITLETTPSTNTAMAAMASELGHATILITHNQSAGRGQRGNSWEAAPGMNVTMSIMLCPTRIAASGQFAASEAVALGVARLLDRYIAPSRVKVKWPNDIYVDDKKIAGILIENTLTGQKIERSIAGIGLNVNQREFVSDAPNPVSIAAVTGCELPLDEVVAQLGATILDAFGRAERDPEGLHAEYLRRLWRADGEYMFAEPSGERFAASIADVAPDGFMTLRIARDGSLRRYAFKEVAFIL